MEYSEAKQKKPGELMFQNNVGNQSDQDVGNQSDQQDNALVYTNSNVSVQDNEANNIMPEKEQKRSLTRDEQKYLSSLLKKASRDSSSSTNNAMAAIKCLDNPIIDDEKKDHKGQKNILTRALASEVQGKGKDKQGNDKYEYYKDQEVAKLLGSNYIEKLANIYALLRSVRTEDKKKRWFGIDAFGGSSKKFLNVFNTFKQLLNVLLTFNTFIKEYRPAIDEHVTNILKSELTGVLVRFNDAFQDWDSALPPIREEDSEEPKNVLRKEIKDFITNRGKIPCPGLKEFNEGWKKHITDEEDEKLDKAYKDIMGEDFVSSGNKKNIEAQGGDSLYYTGNGHYTDDGDTLIETGKNDTNVKKPGHSLQRMFENLGISQVELTRSVDNKTGLIHARNVMLNLFSVMDRESNTYSGKKHGKINGSKILNDWNETIASAGNGNFNDLVLNVMGNNLTGMEQGDYDKLFNDFSLENYDKLTDAFIKDRDQKNKGDLSYRQVPVAYEKNGKVETKNVALDCKFSGAKDIVKELNLGPFEKYFDDKFFKKVGSLLSDNNKGKAQDEVCKPIWYIMFNNPKDIEKLVNKTYFKNCIKFMYYLSNIIAAIGTYYTSSKPKKPEEHKEG